MNCYTCGQPVVFTNDIEGWRLERMYVTEALLTFDIPDNCPDWRTLPIAIPLISRLNELNTLIRDASYQARLEKSESYRVS